MTVGGFVKKVSWRNCTSNPARIGMKLFFASRESHEHSSKISDSSCRIVEWYGNALASLRVSLGKLENSVCRRQKKGSYALMTQAESFAMFSGERL